MKIWAKIGIALFIGLLFNELGVIMEWVIPNADKIYADNAFIDKSYHVKGLTMPYYFYELAGNWYKFIIFFCWYISIKNVRKRLSYIVLTFLLYHFIEMVFYFYNRNTSFVANWITYTVMAILILEIIIPSKKFGKIRNIE